MKDLKKIRSDIDRIDAEMVRLINRRGNLVLNAGKVKERAGKKIYDPSRERSVLRRLAELNKGPVSGDGFKAIYTEIMSACRDLEEKTVVAYLGPEGTFSYTAARRLFGSSAVLNPGKTHQDIFIEVEKGSSEYGVVPVENTIEGTVGINLDLLIDSPLHICGETWIEVEYYLLSAEKEIGRIDKVYTHPQPFGQCRNWLRTNLPNARQIPDTSTTAAAIRVKSMRGAAAIASRDAARLYGLKVLAKRIEDYPNNFTRFLVIGTHDSVKSGNDKTSLILSLKDEPGALLKALSPLSDEGINMTKIASRPNKHKPWEYLFFIDIEGHRTDRHVSRALKKAEKACTFFKELGSYPANK